MPLKLNVKSIIEGLKRALVDGYKGPKSDHFNGTHFHNMDPVKPKKLSEVAAWRRHAIRVPWPQWIETPAMENPPKRVTEDHARITFINHASLLIQTHGINILTDPIWSERTSPVDWAGPKRVRNPALKFDQLPPIDVVLISHNHYDHMDIPTLLNIEKKHKPIYLTGLGNRDFLKKFKLNRVFELDWWRSYKVKDLEFIFVPARHFSRRGFNDAMKTLWGGFVISSAEQKLLFAGDSGYGKHFKLIYNRLGAMDAAMLPIGAYAPKWFMGSVHMDPHEAVQAHFDLDSKISIGIHFGTFQLTDEGIDDPAKELDLAKYNANMEPGSFVAPRFGQVFKLAYGKDQPQSSQSAE